MVASHSPSNKEGKALELVHAFAVALTSKKLEESFEAFGSPIFAPSPGEFQCCARLYLSVHIRKAALLHVQCEDPVLVLPNRERHRDQRLHRPHNEIAVIDDPGVNRNGTRLPKHIHP